MSVRYTFKFNRKQKINSSGKGLIELECYLNRKRKWISTKIWIYPNEWNENKKVVKRINKKYELLNNELKEFEDKYYNFECERARLLRNRDVNFILEDFNKIKDVDNIQKKCFIKFVDQNIKESESIKKWSKRTIKGHKTFLYNLKLFKQTIPFHSMDLIFVKELLFFIANHWGKYGTQWTFEKNFKAFLNIAVDENLITEDKARIVKKKLNRTTPKNKNPKGLTLEEFNLLQNFKAQDVKRQIVVDAFLFSCYTGLRISDCLALNIENVHYNETGEFQLKLMVRKGLNKNNKKPLIIPINKMFKYSGETLSEPCKILQKYILMVNEMKLPDKQNKCFFQVSEAFSNRYLKIVSKEIKCELGNKLTFHTSRHTFAKIVHTHLGVSISLIKELLQHTNITTTMIYENSSEKEREKLLENSNWDNLKKD